VRPPRSGPRREGLAPHGKRGRGGSFMDLAGNARSASRKGDAPSCRSYDRGVRAARMLQR